jgi:5-hydroxyisourate hydrolase-like protein (transthyretin family)
MLSRTGFSGRVENYFEFQPLHAGQASQFLIHLTDLADGSPVERAEVRLAARTKNSANIASQTVARMGKVTGIYIVELNIPQAGNYDVEFHIKSDKLDEHIFSSDFIAIPGSAANAHRASSAVLPDTF